MVYFFKVLSDLFSFPKHNAASVFGEQGKLEPMSTERKAMWRKELDLLLSVAHYIVELVPSQQIREDGTVMEVKTQVSRIQMTRKKLTPFSPHTRIFRISTYEHTVSWLSR